MLDDLQIGEVHAEAIIEKGIEFDVYSEDMPDSKKDKLEAAHEIVSFAIDAWIDDEVHPDADDEDVATAGEQVGEILDLAGVEIDDDNDIEYNEPPELEGEEEEADKEDSYEEEEEAPFDIEDIIEDYDTLKVSEIIEVFESGDLDADDIRAVQEYEEDEGGVRARVLKFEPEEEEGSEEGEEEESEAKEEEEGELDEPYDGYDDASAVDVKKTLTELAEDEELTAEQLEYVLEYEEATKGRKRIIKLVNELLEELEDNGGDEEEEPEEEEEEKPKRRRGRGKARGKGKSRAEEEEEELDEEADDAVARDNEKDKRKSSKKSRKSDDSFEADDEEIEDMLPAGLARVFVKSQIDNARKEIEDRGLEVPEDYEGEMPELPDDISTLGHDELSDLLAQFQNALSTAVTVQSEHYVWANTYEEIADHLENVELVNSDQSNDTKRKAEARSDERVVFFRARHAESYNSYVRFRDLAKTIEGKAKVVSRVGGFMDDEKDTEGRTTAKKSTRGTAKGSAKRGHSRRSSSK